MTSFQLQVAKSQGRSGAGKIAYLVATLSAVVFASGCATMSSKTPEEQVQVRANSYWKARIASDAKAAYELLVPSYRALNSEKDFIRKSGAGAALTETSVASVKCEEMKCIANVALSGKPMVPGIKMNVLTTYLDDVWVLEDGQWWRYEAP